MAISYSQAAVTITEIYRGNLALQDSSIAKKINAPLCFTPRGANVPWRRPPRRSTGAPHRCAVAAQLQGPTAAFRDETTPPCPPLRALERAASCSAPMGAAICARVLLLEKRRGVWRSRARARPDDRWTSLCASGWNRR